MKLIKSLLVVIGLLATAQAATVTISAGFGSSGIVVTSDSVNIGYTVEVGGFADGIFTVFPVTTPVVTKLAGEKIAGSFANNNTDAALLSGDAIFVRILTSAGSAILSTPVGETFPDLTSGIASNSVTLGSSANTSVVQFSGPQLVGVSFSNANTLNFSTIPEPSVALLGALGVFGLVRRRR